MTFVVFSKDRAMQLDAFLRSFRQHVTPVQKVHVLYTATTPRHERAYFDVFSASTAFMTAHRQGSAVSFKADLLRLLQSTGTVALFVDDQLFTRPWAVVELPGLSLRLAPHLTHDYNSGDAPQPLPDFQVSVNGLLSWRWRDGTLSWGYPMSIDGNVYDLARLRPMLAAIQFASPNTLESGLQAYAGKFLDTEAFCYRHAKVVNVPWNCVQTDWANRCGSKYGSDELLGLWEEGFRVDLRSLTGVENYSVHQEFPLVLETR